MGVYEFFFCFLSRGINLKFVLKQFYRNCEIVKTFGSILALGGLLRDRNTLVSAFFLQKIYSTNISFFFCAS